MKDESLSDKMRIFKEGEETWTDGTQEIFLSKDVKEAVQKLMCFNKNKLMGKDFIVISIKDFKEILGEKLLK